MAWIPIDINTSWQDLPTAVQIWQQYSRRLAMLEGVSQSFGGNTITPDTAMTEPDGTVTVFSFIQEMQVRIENLANGWWIDPRIDLAAAYNGATVTTPANQLTCAQLMSVAGLTQSGYWRRIGEGNGPPANYNSYLGAFTYGRIQSKDLAGPWLFTDLQTALSIMTRGILVGMEASGVTRYNINNPTTSRADLPEKWGECDITSYGTTTTTLGRQGPFELFGPSFHLDVRKSRWYAPGDTDPYAGIADLYLQATDYPVTVTPLSTTTAYIEKATSILYHKVVASKAPADAYPYPGDYVVVPAESYELYSTREVIASAAFDARPELTRDVTNCSQIIGSADALLPDSQVMAPEASRTLVETYSLVSIIADFDFQV